MRNFEKYIFGIFLGLSIFSCTNSNSALVDHKIVSAIFDKKEISDLQVILDFFTQEICTAEGGNRSNPQECFNNLENRMLNECLPNGYMLLDIDYVEQKKLYKLSVFDEIWVLDEYGLDLNAYGKYSEYLDLLGQEHKSVKQYSQYLKEAGCLSASMTVVLMALPENYDTSDVGIRLLIAIHYLVHNDKQHRRVEN